MDAWIDIRRKARACHSEALAKTGGDRRAEAILAGVLSIDDLEKQYLDFAPGIAGSLDRSARLISLAKGQLPADEAVVVAHEIGHFRLHLDPHNEVLTGSQTLVGDRVETGAGKVEGYSPRERKEVQADIFAGELLCPADWLREEYLTSHKRPSQIALELGVPISLVLNQMARALLLPPLSPSVPATSRAVIDLDDSQKIAATWEQGPLLVDAGPGTGKTRTLIERVNHLLRKGVLPSSILALTFSNKAAEEMRERMSAMNPEAAIEMWIGTFHAFGLELIRKWPSVVHRTIDVDVLDKTGSLALLEANLAKLPLKHFRNLYEPAFELVNVLQAISRCKDELISPEQYAEAAERAVVEARTDDEREEAEKISEIASIYCIYEKALKEANAVDFGDLVKLSIELIQSNPDVKAYIARFNHVLVDEFQDVNAASATLLRAICTEGTDAWVVADQRQSIYRFRGAEPLNVSNFVSVFSGAKHALGTNYRSVAPVIRAFESFSSVMAEGSISGKWIAFRTEQGGVTLTETSNLAAEGESIAKAVRDFAAKGIPHGDQVILARSHLTLSRIATILEQLGIPLLYLGDLFERPEIRDLLSLVALDAEFGGIGLVRVAALPEYAVAREESIKVIRWSSAQGLPIYQALNRCAEIDGLSDQGRTGLSKLGSQLVGLENASSFQLLSTWLFERSVYLDPLLRTTGAKAQQKLVAIYHLLKVCSQQPPSGATGRKRFLEMIRRIEMLNEETQFRAVSSDAGDMDAVRVMTIHGSKGLEFQVVHLPGLATTYVPSNWRGIRIPCPPSLPQLSMQKDDHHSEEECLFFVALSRARDHLSLSRAEKYTATRNVTASKFLSSITRAVPSVRFIGSGKSYDVVRSLKTIGAQTTYAERDLDLYMNCPARYWYIVVEGLQGERDGSAYLGFHRCVYKTIGWLEEEQQKGNTVRSADALSQLSTVWSNEGPVGHALEGYYRMAAENMVQVMAEAVANEKGRFERQEWSIPIANRQVTITPDRVFIGPDGVVRVQRIRTGRKTSSEPEKPIYALLRRGAQLMYPGKTVVIETFYVATSERVVVNPKNDAAALAKYAEAITAIEGGDFPPEPTPTRCPNCPCYFICEE